MVTKGKKVRSRTNRTLSLLGASGLLAVTVIQTPNLVDSWNELNRQLAHRSNLLNGNSDTAHSLQIDQQLAKVKQEKALYEQSMVGIDAMSDVQSQLMELAQANDCQLRKAIIQNEVVEEWESVADIVDEETAYDAVQNPFELAAQQLTLNLSGSREQTMRFFARIGEKPWMTKVSQINLSRDSDNPGRLNVEASLAFYKLQKNRNAADEMVQWREGNRSTDSK